jgi:ABC-type transport system involved in cytochrome c biogenesis permease subunit
MGVLEAQADAARQVDADQRDLYQRRIIELADHVRLFAAIVQWRAPLVVPPTQTDESWRSLFDASDALDASNGQPRIARAWIDTLIAWQSDDQPKLSEALNELERLVTDPLDAAPRKARAEWLFNQAGPFGDAMALYVLGFVLIMFAWLLRSGTLRWTGVAVMIITLVLHTLAIGLRVYLQGRPPVTNLYSSAVFVGWAACVLALVIEWLFRNGVGVAVACVVGFVTLLIADHLAGDGDTMQMMQAVLDSNFWLTTHVITIILGYSATFLAGGIAVVFMLGAFFTPLIDAAGIRAFGRMIYGTICFALLLSFVGTVLGGIWADQSWGRFWGWDPKENGALMIVLWNALILHARWAGLVRQRGMATMAVFGMIITVWAWFGVNMLGAGLHSYGFMEGTGWYLRLFIAITLALTGIGMLPRKLWWSLAKVDYEQAQRQTSAPGQRGPAPATSTPAPGQPESPAAGS